MYKSVLKKVLLNQKSRTIIIHPEALLKLELQAVVHFAKEILLIRNVIFTFNIGASTVTTSDASKAKTVLQLCKCPFTESSW